MTVSVTRADTTKVVDQQYGWTLAQAVERLSAEAWSKHKIGDWRECAAYAVIQWITAEARLARGYTGETLALARIETIISELRELQRHQVVAFPTAEQSDLFAEDGAA